MSKNIPDDLVLCNKKYPVTDCSNCFHSKAYHGNEGCIVINDISTPTAKGCECPSWIDSGLPDVRCQVEKGQLNGQKDTVFEYDDDGNTISETPGAWVHVHKGSNVDTNETYRWEDTDD